MHLLLLFNHKPEGVAEGQQAVPESGGAGGGSGRRRKRSRVEVEARRRFGATVSRRAVYIDVFAQFRREQKPEPSSAPAADVIPFRTKPVGRLSDLALALPAIDAGVADVVDQIKRQAEAAAEEAERLARNKAIAFLLLGETSEPETMRDDRISDAAVALLLLT